MAYLSKVCHVVEESGVTAVDKFWRHGYITEDKRHSKVSTLFPRAALCLLYVLFLVRLLKHVIIQRLYKHVYTYLQIRVTKTSGRFQYN